MRAILFGIIVAFVIGITGCGGGVGQPPSGSQTLQIDSDQDTQSDIPGTRQTKTGDDLDNPPAPPDYPSDDGEPMLPPPPPPSYP